MAILEPVLSCKATRSGKSVKGRSFFAMKKATWNMFTMRSRKPASITLPTWMPVSLTGSTAACACRISARTHAMWLALAACGSKLVQRSARKPLKRFADLQQSNQTLVAFLLLIKGTRNNKTFLQRLRCILWVITLHSTISYYKMRFYTRKTELEASTCQFPRKLRS